MRLSPLKSALLAALFVSVATPGYLAHASQGKEVLLNETVDYNVAKVEKQGTTCSLLYMSHDKAIFFMIGETVVTSQISFAFPKDIGSQGGELQLELVTRESDAPRTSLFSKSALPQGLYKYTTALSNLQIDMDDLERTFAFHLSDPGKSGSTATLHFSDELRDRAVTALRSCSASLDSHWRAD